MAGRSPALLVAALAFALVGCGKKSASPSTAASAVPPALIAQGEQVYLKNCAQCHMADGGGVPNMQPELIGSAIVAGDLVKLEAVIRAGSFALRDRQSDFKNEMPPFPMLSDAEIKAVIAYVRAKFGKAATAGEARTSTP